MDRATEPTADAGLAPDEVLEIVRSFDAPAALLFKLWSEPEHLVRWLPEGLISLECEVDFREGHHSDVGVGEIVVEGRRSCHGHRPEVGAFRCEGARV